MASPEVRASGATSAQSDARLLGEPHLLELRLADEPEHRAGARPFNSCGGRSGQCFSGEGIHNIVCIYIILYIPGAPFVT